MNLEIIYLYQARDMFTLQPIGERQRKSYPMPTMNCSTLWRSPEEKPTMSMSGTMKRTLPNFGEKFT